MSERLSTFFRNAGVDSSHGANFEWENTLLCYLECENQHQIWKRTGNSGVKSFYVANNVQGVGAFDDIVYRVEYVDEGEIKTKLIFIQCKHVEGETSERKFQNYLGAKQIKKYFESFLMVRNVFEDDSPSKRENQPGGTATLREDIQNKQDLKFLFSCRFTECEFWYVSNMDFKNSNCNYLVQNQEGTKKIPFIFPGHWDARKVFKLLCNETYKLLDDSKYDKSLISEFCKSFRIFLNVDEVNDQIYNVIHTLMEERAINYTVKENLCESLLKETKYILKSGTLLTEETSMFGKIFDFLSLKKSSEDLINKSRHTLTLSTTDAMEVISYFQLNNKTRYKRLSELKIFQAFLQANKENLCIVLNSEDEVKLWQLARQTHVYRNVNNILIYFKGNLTLPMKKEENERFLKIMHTAENHENYKILKQISAEEVTVLENYKVKFQGFEIKMKEFCGSWMDILDEDAVCDILETKRFNIGMNLQSNQNFYLPRNLKIKVLNGETINKIKNVIAAGGKFKYLLFAHGDMIIDKKNGNPYKFYDNFDEAYKYFDQFSTKKDISFFLCTCSNDDLKLQYSFGRDITCLDEKIVAEDFVLDNFNNNKITILSDVAGMGKSTSMLKLSSDYKARNKSHWVLFIQLGKYSKIFEHAKDLDVESNAVEFIASQLWFPEQKKKVEQKTVEHGNIEKKLLINACMETGKVAIFFDGFDELSSSAGKVFIIFLLAINRTKISRIFVSSRQKSVDRLEIQTMQNSIDFLELKSKEKEDCLIGIWKQRIYKKDTIIKEEKLKDIANQLNNALESEENFIHEILGIPLQIKMIADAYYDEMIEYCKSDVAVQFNIDLELLRLYKRFIHSQVIHYYTDKLNVNWNSLQEQQKNRHIREKLRDSTELVCSLLIPNLFKPNSKDMSEVFIALRDDLGLITDDTYSPPLFLHRTIAEYLAAEYMVTSVLSQEIDDEKLEIVVSIFTEDEYDIFRKFINSFLDENNLPKYLESIGSRTSESAFRLFGDKQTPFYTAAYEGNIKLVKAFLGSSKSSINHQSAYGETALHTACLKNKTEVVKLLLNHDCSINELDRGGHTVLHHAAEGGQVFVMEQLLKRNTSLLNMQNYIGITPLHLASAVGNIEAVEFLLNQDCSVETRSNTGNTAFHFAAERNHIKILEILLTRNESLLNSQNNDGQTSLHVACWEGKIEAAEFLVRHDCSVTERDGCGNTVFHYASYKDQIQILDLLLQQHNSLLNIKDKDGNTTLHVACLFGKINVVLYLLSKDCSVTDCNNSGFSALHCAAKNNHIEIMRLLLHRDTSLLNMQNKYSQTALHLACMEPNSEAVQILLSYDCSVNERDVNGKTAFHSAARRHFVNTMELLLEREKSLLNMQTNEGVTPLHLACFDGRTDAVQFLLNHGCSGKDSDNHGSNAFFFAAERYHVLLMELLLQHDDSLMNSRDNHGVTPLQQAVAHYHTDTLKFLLNRGCSLNNRDNDGDTVFNEASLNNNVEALELLLQHDKSLMNEANDEGDTPLHHACRKGNEAVITILLSINECSRILYNNEGNTPFQEAIKNGHVQVIKQFLQIDKSFLNMRNKQNLTPMHIACCEGKLEVVKLLLKNECTIKEVDNQGDTALHKAALNGHCEILNLILERDKSLKNIKNNDGFEPLNLALSNVQIEAANFLLEFCDSKKNCTIC